MLKAHSFLWISITLTSCFQAGVQNVGSQTRIGSTYKTVEIKNTLTETGGVSATLSSTSLSSQLMKVTEGSTIQGTQAVFPPGSLSINTNITIEESAPIATATLTSELGINPGITQSGTAVTVMSSTPTDAKQPFALSIPLPILASLNQDIWSHLVVMYRVTINEENRSVSGIIPRSDITINDGVAQIATKYFGSFQAAITSIAVTDKIVADTKAAILTKSESDNLPPMKVLSRTPFVVKADGVIQINGLNFRPTMILALGGVKVTDLKIASDTKASFTAPKVTSFGLVDIAVEQDGLSQTVSVVYAGTKTDLPLIMKTEVEVCEGEKYYDGSGTLRIGSRICIARDVCSGEGQVDCIANINFPAVNKALLASKIAVGQAVASVSGTVPVRPADCNGDGTQGCVAVSAFPAFQAAGANLKIVSGATLGGISGSAGSRPADCSTDGGLSCVTTTNFPSVDLSNLNANRSKISNFVTLGGVQGTLLNCSANGSGCFLPSYSISTQPLKAIDFNALSPSDIRSGTIIGGISGNLLAAPANCTADAQSGCVTVTGFPSVDKNYLNTNKAKISDALSLGGINGTLSNCTIDAQTACLTTTIFKAADTSTIQDSWIKSGQMIAGIYGSLMIPNSWDIRVGVVAGTTVGKLKVDCRNSSSLSTFDFGIPRMATAAAATDFITLPAHGFSNGQQVRIGYGISGGLGLSDINLYYVQSLDGNTFYVSTTSGGAAVDITADGPLTVAPANTGAASFASTIDDFNNGGSFPTGNAWSSTDNTCSGIDTSGISANVWKDITVGGCTTGTDCRFKDQITNLEWSKPQGSVVWQSALANCDMLTYDGYSDWRLPTQKELMGAYIHGIKSAASSNWIALTDLTSPFWSATHASVSTYQAFGIFLGQGTSQTLTTTTSSKFVCVRNN